MTAKRTGSLICGAGQADAAVVAQGIDHVLHQPLEGRLAQNVRVHRSGHLAQSGMSHADDAANGHVKNPCAG